MHKSCGLQPCNLRNLYNDTTCEHIITMLRYAVVKNKASAKRNTIRSRSNCTLREYSDAGRMCRNITADWLSTVRIARKCLGSPFKLSSDRSMGYSWFILHDSAIYRKDFQKFIDIYETEKAIETLLKGEDHVTNTTAS